MSQPPSSTSTPSKPRRPSNSNSSTPRSRARAGSNVGGSGLDPPFVSHEQALVSIRNFLKGRSSYDVFPVSFRLIVLDTKLMVKKALGVMLQNGVISAPLWNSDTSTFAGMLTVSDIIHLIQYYYYTQTYEEAAVDVEHFRLEMLREIERSIGVPPPPLLSVHPLHPLFEAAKLLQKTHARRLPLIDRDEQSGGEVVLSVLTQYRVLKFIAVNCPITSSLTRPLRACQIGTYVAPESERPRGPTQPYWPIATATLQTTVFDVVHMFSEKGISAVPILDDQGVVVNLYETVDVITLLRLGAYTSLDLTISQALARRSTDFPGVVTCTPDDSLANLFQLIRKRRLHRLVVVDGTDDPTADPPRKKGRLVGIISLSDVLRYVISEGEHEAEKEVPMDVKEHRDEAVLRGDGKAMGDVPEVTVSHHGGGGTDSGTTPTALSSDTTTLMDSTTTPPFPPATPLPDIVDIDVSLAE